MFINKLAGRSASGRNLRSGFTLIELLVVVLIIGILASVALPQYQKSVDRARLTEVLTVMDAVRKGVDLYYLENGLVATSGSELLDSLAIEIPVGITKPGESWDSTKSRIQFSSVFGDGRNGYFVYVMVSPHLQGMEYMLQTNFMGGKWGNYCTPIDFGPSKGKVGADACQYLRSIGWVS